MHMKHRRHTLFIAFTRLQPRSEAWLWQWCREVVVLVVGTVEEVHPLHAEERDAVREDARKVGHTARESGATLLQVEVPRLVESKRSALVGVVDLAVDVHADVLLEILEERI